MSIAKYDRSQPLAGHHLPVWAGRIALLLSALVSLLTGVSQARASVADHSQLSAAVLADHNQLRTKLNIPPMAWNEELAHRAAAWADHLARLGYMMHSGAPEGENIWMGSAGEYSYDIMVRDWADEGRFFRAGYFPNVSTTGNWQDAAHFTQMVWRETRRVGCGVASRDGWDILVCRYSTPGNVLGRKPY